MITDKDMQDLQKLARLKVSDEESHHLKDELNKIMAYFEQIKDLDTEGIEELARPIDTFNIFRKDEQIITNSQADALKLAVEAEDGFFKVPRTIDND